MSKSKKNGDIANVSESIDWINLELTENEKFQSIEEAYENMRNIHQLTMIPKEYFGRK